MKTYISCLMLTAALVDLTSGISMSAARHHSKRRIFDFNDVDKVVHEEETVNQTEDASPEVLNNEVDDETLTPDADGQKKSPNLAREERLFNKQEVQTLKKIAREERVAERKAAEALVEGEECEDCEDGEAASVADAAITDDTVTGDAVVVGDGTDAVVVTDGTTNDAVVVDGEATTTDTVTNDTAITDVATDESTLNTVPLLDLLSSVTHPDSHTLS